MAEIEGQERNENGKPDCQAEPEVKCKSCGCQSLVSTPCGVRCPACGEGGCEQ